MIIMTADLADSAYTTATPAATTVDTVTPTVFPGTAVIDAITAVNTSTAVLTNITKKRLEKTRVKSTFSA